MSRIVAVAGWTRLLQARPAHREVRAQQHVTGAGVKPDSGGPLPAYGHDVAYSVPPFGALRAVQAVRAPQRVLQARRGLPPQKLEC